VGVLITAGHGAGVVPVLRCGQIDLSHCPHLLRTAA
jgi:hypothetical protein